MLWRGWATKFFGYGMQGGCRFGLYEYFKNLYSNMLPDSNRNVVFFASSASAEVVANVVLCPFEAIEVRVQAQPIFGKGLLDGFPKLYAAEGLHGYDIFVIDMSYVDKLFVLISSIDSYCFFISICSFYRGLIPLWGRNLPCKPCISITLIY